MLTAGEGKAILGPSVWGCEVEANTTERRGFLRETHGGPRKAREWCSEKLQRVSFAGSGEAARQVKSKGKRQNEDKKDWGHGRLACFSQ